SAARTTARNQATPHGPPFPAEQNDCEAPSRAKLRLATWSCVIPGQDCELFRSSQKLFAGEACLRGRRRIGYVTPVRCARALRRESPGRKWNRKSSVISRQSSVVSG